MIRMILDAMARKRRIRRYIRQIGKLGYSYDGLRRMAYRNKELKGRARYYE